MKEKINVLIVDDHPIVIEAYKNAINTLPQNIHLTTASNIKQAKCLLDSSSKKGLKFNLVILDVRLPKANGLKFTSGEDLGVYIKNLSPETRILIITSLNDTLRLVNVVKRVSPEGLIVKSDLNSSGLLFAIKEVLSGKVYFSSSINNLFKKRTISEFILDELDLQILIELSNGSKMKELKHLIPLTKSGIDKRKKIMKDKFGLNSTNDRDLVLAAKSRGFL